MGKLTDRMYSLENKIKTLESRIEALTKDVTTKRIPPESRVPYINQSNMGYILPSTGTGLGKVFGNQSNIIWNDAETKLPAWGQQPEKPTKAYQKHGHSRYAGGALDIHTLELVEYETNENGEIIDSYGNALNRHSQSWWKNLPKIVKDGEIEKVGLLDIQFDPTSKKWVTGANMIDVERTYLVQYIWIKNEIVVPAGTEGATKEVKKDGNGIEMKAPLLFSILAPLGETEEKRIIRENEMLNKSNVYWDTNAKCWRFYAVFKPFPEEEEEEE